MSPASQAVAGFISKYNKTKKSSESAGEKKHEIAITIPVVLPDKDYPPATSNDFRIEIWSGTYIICRKAKIGRTYNNALQLFETEIANVHLNLLPKYLIAFFGTTVNISQSQYPD